MTTVDLRQHERCGPQCWTRGLEGAAPAPPGAIGGCVAGPGRALCWARGPEPEGPELEA